MGRRNNVAWTNSRPLIPSCTTHPTTVKEHISNPPLANRRRVTWLLSFLRVSDCADCAKKSAKNHFGFNYKKNHGVLVRYPSRGMLHVHVSRRWAEGPQQRAHRDSGPREVHRWHLLSTRCPMTQLVQDEGKPVASTSNFNQCTFNISYE
eukprot:1185436-Prorocentrum_minimum.AAC.2